MCRRPTALFWTFHLPVIHPCFVPVWMNLTGFMDPLVSVNKLDAESSKSAFVSSATALEKWIALAGLGGQLKGYWCEGCTGCCMYGSGICESPKEGTVTENWIQISVLEQHSSILINQETGIIFETVITVIGNEVVLYFVVRCYFWNSNKQLMASFLIQNLLPRFLTLER